MRKLLASILALASRLLALPAAAQACSGPAAVCPGLSGALPLIQEGRPMPVLTDGAIGPGPTRAAQDLEQDLWRVAGHAGRPTAAVDRTGPMIIIGTLGKSPIIDGLVRSGRLDVTPIRGKWEAFQTAVVDNPVAGTRKALVIVGADTRQ